MKKILKLFALVPLIFSTLTGCGEKQLVLASWGEYFNNDNIKLLEKEVGMKIKLVEYASNEILHKQMISNNYDVIIPSEYMVAKLRDEGKISLLDLTSLGLSKDDFIGPVKNSYNEYSNGSLWQYGIPITTGDLRVHVNPKVHTKIMNAIKGKTIDITKLINIPDVKFGLTDDVRNAVLIAMAYQQGGKVNAQQAANPSIIEASKALEALFNKKESKIGFSDEAILPEEWLSGKYDVIISYNTDPNWSLKDIETYPEVDAGFGEDRNYYSYQIAHYSNLWIDNVSLVKDANPKAKDLIKAIFKHYDKMAYIDNGFNATLTKTFNQQLENFTGQEKINFILNPDYTHYGIFKYRYKDNINYNDELIKVFTKYRTK